MAEGDNTIRATLPKDGFYLWALRRIAARLGSADGRDTGEAVRWLLQRITEIDAEYLTSRFGVSQEAFDKERQPNVLRMAREAAAVEEKRVDAPSRKTSAKGDKTS